jgi:transitional endoplasmic reticulum ATPase
MVDAALWAWSRRSGSSSAGSSCRSPSRGLPPAMPSRRRKPSCCSALRGTGKTTFAKSIASRLAWPFVELEPAELAGEGPERPAKLLADAFELIVELSSAVVFADEVEDLASIRHQERRASPSVTNEFLKQIPRLRDAPQHLLVCATNWVSRLDPAFFRPGRFDYVLPVGPPDEQARRAIRRRYT